MPLEMDSASIATDYAAGTGDPLPYLRRIAEAGFSHVHWCHEWCTDYLYTDDEITRIGACLTENRLRLHDLHATTGATVHWAAPDEAKRRGGLALVQNRLRMTALLEGRTIVLHLPQATSPEMPPAGWDAIRWSLDELEPFARRHDVRIALENLPADCADAIRTLLAEYPPDFLGFCYDAGHGNMLANGPALLAMLRDRLIAMHLHDNDGTGDQHRLPFTGTVDWHALMREIATSAYAGPITLEVSLGNAPDEAAFLTQARACATRLLALQKGESTVSVEAA